MINKKCNKCSITKSIDSFSRRASSTDGYRNICKDCHNKYVREEWYPKNKERHIKSVTKYKKKNKAKVLSYRYNSSEEEIKKLLNKSDGDCEICKEKNSLCIDHDHNTGEIRGLLCGSCNTALGHFKDNVEIIQSAVNYLKLREELVFKSVS